MKLTNEWFYFIGAITPEKCDEIIELGHQLKFEEGQAAADLGELTPEERKIGRKNIHGKSKFRESGVVFTDSQDIYDLVFPFMSYANKDAAWDFDIVSCEMPQITQYKKGQFYNWHSDGLSDRLSMYTKETHGDNKLMVGNVRKLSMTILLNDGYKGGKFQFKTQGGVKEKFETKISTLDVMKKGSVIVFPSSMVHRITPVTKGVRYSLVAWFLGPPFK